MPAHLILRLEAPLMSFGGDMIDAYGVVRDFPARSMVTGVIANALGWERWEAERHSKLQDRLVMGAVRLREGRRVRDFQTAQLGAGDRGWTTRGRFERRAGGAATYQSPHIRYRDADADALVLVALRLEPAGDAPDLGAVAAALDRPERPLFVGRKPFLPSCPLSLATVDAADVRGALMAAVKMVAPTLDGASEAEPRAQWPLAEGGGEHVRAEELTDERDWVTGVHAGLRRVIVDRLGPA